MFFKKLVQYFSKKTKLYEIHNIKCYLKPIISESEGATAIVTVENKINTNKI